MNVNTGTTHQDFGRDVCPNPLTGNAVLKYPRSLEELS
jgi:hypothetical protein